MRETIPSSLYTHSTILPTQFHVVQLDDAPTEQTTSGVRTSQHHAQLDTA